MAKKKKIVKVVDIVAAKEGKKKSPPHEELRITGDSAKIIDPSPEPQDTAPSMDWLNASPANQEPVQKTKGISKRPARKWRIIAGIGIVFAILAFTASKLPKAEVRITMKKSSVAYQESVYAKTSVGEVRSDTREIPGEIVTKKINHEYAYTPTGQTNEEQKASGTIIIHNDYSSAPQVLVATTRFETPEGKIYRLTDRVTVPGSPGTLEATVIADEAGPEYNTEGVARLEVPGFKGGPRYTKFWGEIKDPLNGGTRGLTAYPTQTDIADAQKDAENKLYADLRSLVILQLPAGVKLLEGGDTFTVTAKHANTSLNADGKFSVDIEGQIKAFVFKEDDIHSFVRQLALDAQAISDDSQEKDFTVSYGEPFVQIDLGNMEIPLDIQATYWKNMDVQQIRSQIAGKKSMDIKSAILSMEGVDKLSVSFWPFWVSRAPMNIDRIAVTVE